MSNVKLELKRVFPAKVSEVFEAWTQPAVLQQWFAPGEMSAAVDADVRAGGSYRIVMRRPDGQVHTVTGVYKELVQNEKLVFTWGWEGEQRHESQVTVMLVDRGGETELTLLHELLASEESKAQHAHGWEGCLDKLAARWR